jgi:hypothetical protein
MPFSPRAILYFIVHCVITIVIFKIVEILLVWIGGQIHLDIIVSLATWIALLIALSYFVYGWYWYRGRTPGPG